MALVTLVPLGMQQPQQHSLAPRLSSLNGARVGILYNVKKNAKELLVDIASILRDRYNVEVLEPVLTAGKSGMIALPEQLTELASKADFVLSGLGDCGSCTSCSVLNATELEKMGVPSVTIVTEPFSNTAASFAKRRGFAGYRYIVVEHPLSSARPESIRERAEKAVPEVVAIVLGDVAGATRERVLAAAS